MIDTSYCRPDIKEVLKKGASRLFIKNARRRGYIINEKNALFE